MSFVTVAFHRSPAIVLTLFLELFVGLIIASFKKYQLTTDIKVLILSHQRLLAKHLLLASFLPVLSSISGTISLQSSTSTLRALATGLATATTFSSTLPLLRKELFSSALLALTSSSLLFLISLWWSLNLRFAIATCLAILMNASIAGTLGTLAPIAFRKLGVDPALMAGPFETAIQGNWPRINI